MDNRQYGQSGLRLSVLSLGAMTMGESHGFMKGVVSNDDEARRVLDAGLEAGLHTIDTANIYSEGRSEELLGRWMQGKRERVTLLTKCRFPTLGSTGKMLDSQVGASRASIIWNCEQSLKRLQTDYIDLYQIHMQEASVPVEETLRALDDLKTAGKIRYAGCSNYAGYRLAEALWVSDKRNLSRYEGIQLQWSLVSRDVERELIPAAKAFGLGLLVWSPLAAGFLSGKYEKGAPAPTGSRLAAWKDSFASRANETSWKILDTVKEIAKKHETTPAAVSLAWLIRKPEVSSVIIGARSVEQLKDNLRAADLKLEDADVNALLEVSKPTPGYPYDFIGSR